METEPLAGLNVLVLEDEPLWRRHVVAGLERLGAEVAAVDRVASARERLSRENFDFALLDVNLPDGLGPDLLREGLVPSHTRAVVMTAEGGIRGAVEAMRLGALDYLQKPFEPEALALTLRRARGSRAAERLEEQRRSGAPGLFFGSALAPVEAQVRRILAADARLGSGLPPVLVQGETGTGKTTLARWLHAEGPRASGPLVEANCSAIPDALAESELFGHERGAFTDARSARIGLFEAAHGGTLFLDEVASLSPAVQAKLLTALEDRRIRRLGGTRWIPVDVRVVAAANRDLRSLAADGAFREDLLHRLDLFRIVLPPLRERTADLPHLAEVLLRRTAERHRLPRRPLSEAGRRRLLGYAWPGNVRELMHELERAVVFEDGPELHLESLIGAGAGVGGTAAPDGDPDTGGQDDWFNPSFHFPDSGFSLEDAVLRLVRSALDQTGGNVSAAARILGVSRDYLRHRLGTAGARAARPVPTPAGR